MVTDWGEAPCNILFTDPCFQCCRCVLSTDPTRHCLQVYCSQRSGLSLRMAVIFNAWPCHSSLYEVNESVKSEQILIVQVTPGVKRGEVVIIVEYEPVHYLLMPCNCASACTSVYVLCVCMHLCVYVFVYVCICVCMCCMYVFVCTVICFNVSGNARWPGLSGPSLLWYRQVSSPDLLCYRYTVYALFYPWCTM